MSLAPAQPSEAGMVLFHRGADPAPVKSLAHGCKAGQREGVISVTELLSQPKGSASWSGTFSALQDADPPPPPTPNSQWLFPFVLEE